MRLPDKERFLPASSFSGTALAVSGLLGLCVWWLCFGGGALSAGTGCQPSWPDDLHGDGADMVASRSPEAEALRPRPGIVDQVALSLRSVIRRSGLVKLAWLPWLSSGPDLASPSSGVSSHDEGAGYKTVLGGGLLIRAGP